MTPSTEETPKNRTQLFSVVGAYVPEDRADRHHHAKFPEVRPPEAGVAGVWLAFYVVLFVISIFTTGGAAKLADFVMLR